MKPKENSSNNEEPLQPPHVIELRLRDLNQLFNSMDPSPFYEKDLDSDAEEFIVGWAEELPAKGPLLLAIHVEKPPGPDATERTREAVHNFFRSRTQVMRRQLRQLLARGRTSLIIGLIFLTACIVASELLGGLARGSAEGTGQLFTVLEQSLIIAGWVAMWRPLEVFLYDWWPIRNSLRLARKMSGMELEIIEVPRVQSTR